MVWCILAENSLKLNCFRIYVVGKKIRKACHSCSQVIIFCPDNRVRQSFRKTGICLLMSCRSDKTWHPVRSIVAWPGESPAPVFPDGIKTGLQLQGLSGAKICEWVVSMSAALWSQTVIIPCSCWAFLGSLQDQQFFCGALTTGYSRVDLEMFLTGTAELQMGL